MIVARRDDRRRMLEALHSESAWLAACLMAAWGAKVTPAELLGDTARAESKVSDPALKRAILESTFGAKKAG